MNPFRSSLGERKDGIYFKENGMQGESEIIPSLKNGGENNISNRCAMLLGRTAVAWKRIWFTGREVVSSG
jgi:hypothetical protein